MSAWKEYSPRVAIAAGAIISGVYFFQRTLPIPYAEDVAEIIAAVQEREAWITATGTNAPAYGYTNKIGFAMLWDDLYYRGMDEARRLAVRPPYIAAWLDRRQAWPEDGSYLTQGTPSWIETAGTWNFTLNNCVEKLRTSSTRQPGDGDHQWLLYRWAEISATNAPLLRATGLQPWGSIGSLPTGWWNDIGNGATNYLYSCDLPITNANAWPPIYPGDSGFSIRTLRRANLEESWNVLTNLTRTITFSSARGDEVIEIFSGTYKLPQGSPPTDPRQNIIVAYGNMTHTSTITNSDALFAEYGTHFAEGYSRGGGAYVGHYYIERRNMRNVICDYPAASAFSQGKIRRIAYFIAPKGHSYASSTGGGDGVTYSRTDVEADRDICPLNFPAFGAPPTPTESTIVKFPPRNISTRLTLVAAFYNPTKQPVFNIPHQTTLARQEPVWYYSSAAGLEAIWYADEIIVVVDWKWDYCPDLED